MSNLPEIFLSRMRDFFGAEEFADFLASYENAPTRGVRLNMLKHETTRNSPEIPWCKTGFYYADDRPAKTIAYHAGLFYIQEPSAMCPVEVLGVEAGHRVLDICAAPGGKSVQIAGFLGGEGVLVSNDASASRCRALVNNLERAGVTNAVVLTEQPVRLAERFRGYFDRVLVDAPCSGEGMFRRDADAAKAYTANKPDACAAVQTEILRHAAAMLAPGGRLVYSTCTFNPLENEGVIADFLRRNEGFSLVEIDHAALGISPGREGLPQTARILPHVSKGEGHFVALIEREKSANESGGVAQRDSRTHCPPREFTEFCENFLCFSTEGKNFFLHKNSLFLQNFPMDLKGLRVARSGFFLGEVAKGRFVPSHSLAMGLRKEEARFAVELDEADAFRFLRGESLFSDAAFPVEKPWILICHGGHPLGWARLVQGRLKNNLPRGWAIN